MDLTDAVLWPLDQTNQYQMPVNECKKHTEAVLVFK